MKTLRLSIGNYLHSNLTGKIFQVMAKDIVNIDNNFTVADPIPLTEQWLKDFGFADKGTVFKKGWFELWYSSYAENYQLRIYKIGSTFEKIINVEFVHTLQNLFFSLTKTELTKK